VVGGGKSHPLASFFFCRTSFWPDGRRPPPPSPAPRAAGSPAFVFCFVLDGVPPPPPPPVTFLLFPRARADIQAIPSGFVEKIRMKVGNSRGGEKIEKKYRGPELVGPFLPQPIASVLAPRPQSGALGLAPPPRPDTPAESIFPQAPPPPKRGPHYPLGFTAQRVFGGKEGLMCPRPGPPPGSSPSVPNCPPEPAPVDRDFW